MSGKEIGLGEFVADLTPFPEWLSKLTPAERERVMNDVQDLNELDYPDAEALVRADFYSPFAEVTRVKSIWRARRNALRMWDLDADEQDLITHFLAGKSLWRCGEMSRAVRMMHDAGLPKESIAEIGRLIAGFAVFTVTYHLDTGSIHGYQSATEFLVMEVRVDRATDRQATGGKWADPSGRPLHGPWNPFPSPAHPSQGGLEGDDPK